MTNEAAAKIVADITISTIEHMAQKVGLSSEDTLAAICAGGNARKDFDTIEAQQRRIEALEAALNPFANEASEYDQGQFEDRDSPYFNTFNIGQLRTARAALNHKETAA